VLGAVRPAEVLDNIASLAVPVPASLWSDLKSAGLIAAHAPTPE